MADTRLEQLKDSLARAKAYAARVREEGERMTETASKTMLTMGGGAVAAVLDTKMPMVPGTQIPTRAAVGAALAAAAVFDMAGDYSDELAAVGAGMLAVEAYQRTQSMLRA